MKITLLRHGKPDFNWSQNIKGTALTQIKADYNAAGIIDSPPEGVQALVEQHSIVVCSDLARSIHSAKALGVNTIYRSDALFKEMDIPVCDVSIKLPLKLWVLILRGMWFLGYANHTESIDLGKARAKLAAQTLIQLAHKFDSVVFVGHGFINHYIAKQLLMQHWSRQSFSGRKYWDFSIYTRTV